jgi:hypothetical protein
VSHQPQHGTQNENSFLLSHFSSQLFNLFPPTGQALRQPQPKYEGTIPIHDTGATGGSFLVGGSTLGRWAGGAAIFFCVFFDKHSISLIMSDTGPCYWTLSYKRSMRPYLSPLFIALSEQIVLQIPNIKFVTQRCLSSHL